MDPISITKAGTTVVRLYKSVGGWLERRRRQRLEKWFALVCTAPFWGASPEIVQEEIRRALEEDEDESRREAMWLAVKQLVDCVSDESLVPIASLTAERLQAKLPIDVFYRGAIRLLADLSGGELEQLRTILSIAERANPAHEGPIRLVAAPPKFFRVDDIIGEEESTHGEETSLTFNPVRLVTLLRDSHLGYELSRMLGTAVAVDIDRETIRMLGRHVAPSVGSR